MRNCDHKGLWFGPSHDVYCADCEDVWISGSDFDRLRKENAELREALLELAYTVSPNPKDLQPNWDVLSYEAVFAPAMEKARKVLASQSTSKDDLR